MKSIKRLARAAVLLAAVIFAVPSLAAQAPKSWEELPVFRGAVMTEEDIAPPGQGLRSGARRTYLVAASPEQVLAYYETLAKVQGRFLDPEDENGLAVGKTTAPACQVYFWDESTLVDEDVKFGPPIRRGWIKKALQGRKKDREGKWVESANMEWHYRDTKGSMTKLHVMIQDLSVNEDAGTYSLKTEIIVEVMNYDYEI